MAIDRNFTDRDSAGVKGSRGDPKSLPIALCTSPDVLPAVKLRAGLRSPPAVRQRDIKILLLRVLEDGANPGIQRRSRIVAGM